MGALAGEDDGEIAAAAAFSRQCAVGQCGFVCKRRDLAPRALFYQRSGGSGANLFIAVNHDVIADAAGIRSEEHTSELQSRENLVCRLLLEKKKKNRISHI